MIKFCIVCADEIDPPARAERQLANDEPLLCVFCGEEHARNQRKSWTVVQEYQKGGYMFVTAQAAHATLKQTNQKAVRT